jgi:hypothetical protein
MTPRQVRIQGYLKMRSVLRDIELDPATPPDLLDKCARDVDKRWRSLLLSERERIRRVFVDELETSRWLN